VPLSVGHQQVPDHFFLQPFLICITNNQIIIRELGIYNVTHTCLLKGHIKGIKPRPVGSTCYDTNNVTPYNPDFELLNKEYIFNYNSCYTCSTLTSFLTFDLYYLLYHSTLYYFNSHKILKTTKT